MKKISFCEGWTFAEEGQEFHPVTLPHDAQILKKRDPSVSDGGHGYFPGGKYIYEKRFSGEGLKGKNVLIVFEGIYRNSTVIFNGRTIGGHHYGYSEFSVRLDDIQDENILRVEADNSELPNSRWYTGGGIYRPVWLYEGGKDPIALHGVKITTLSIDPAVIRVETETEAETARIEIFDQGKLIAYGEGRTCEITIPNAKLWSDEDPYLYTCRVSTGTDEAEETFGIRTIAWSTKGLFVNGKETLLRGGCVHHDSGVLGAATLDESEFRRVRILKENGFNAIRSSHNPASRALLEACDHYGMYVMDELADMWYNRKTKYDYGLNFMEDWKEDAELMVRKDYNHPSVLMYSIGNEVAEPHEEKGQKLGEEITAYLHSVDQTRPVTIGLNLMILNRAAQGKGIYQDGEMSEQGSEKKKESQNASLGFNMIASFIGSGMNKAGNSKKIDAMADPIIRTVDIAGYNYASGRYPLEEKQHPERIIVGSETFPQDIWKNWQMVKKYPYLLGDFMWTSWDYLGEAGIGAWSYTGGMPFNRPYPWLLAGAGVIDITGRPDASCRYAETVWDLLEKPVIAVRPLNHPGVRPAKSVWRGTNAVESWAWENCDGNEAFIEVYSKYPVVELVLNNRIIGRKKTKECRAFFKTKYEPGKLEAYAVSEKGGIVSDACLISAEGKKTVCLTAEKPFCSDSEIIYVDVEIRGENGVLESACDRTLKAETENCELLGFGSANPCTEESYTSGTFTTYMGRALAVIRRTSQEPAVLRIIDQDSTAELRIPD